MPWTFLNPAMLLGALAAGIPLLLHLLQNRRPRRVEFSDLTFLRAIASDRSRSLGVKRWLLLALRMLIIVLLAMGAARPRLGGLAPEAGDGASLLILLDASATMQARDPDGVTRFEEAVTAALNLTRGLGRRGEVQWLLAGTEPQPVFGDWLPASGAADRPPEGLNPGDGICDLAASLRAAADLCDEARSLPVVVLITDGRPPASEATALAAAGAALKSRGVETVETILVGSPSINGGVRTLREPVRTVRPGDVLEIGAEVVAAREGQAFQLELDGRVQAEAVADGTGSGLTFAVTAPAAGLHVGSLRTDHDALEADDRRPFLLDVRPRLNVLLIHGEAPSPAGRGGWRYLARALDPDGDQGETGPVVLESVDPDGWQGGDLDRYDVVILAAAGSPGRDRLEALEAWLQAGGRLWLVLGDPAGAATGPEHVLNRLAGIDGARHRVLSAAGGARWRTVAATHPILEGLPPEALATLEETVWQRNWTLAPGSVGGLEILAELEDGDPLLLAGAVGRGRLVLQTAALGTGTTDLSRSAMVLPLVQRVASWLAAGRGGPPVLTAGRPLVWEPDPARLSGLNGGGDAVLHFTPTRDRAPARTLDARLDWSGPRPMVHGPRDPGAGHWFLTVGGDTVAAAVTVLPAAEVDGGGGPAPAGAIVAGTGLTAGGRLGDASERAVAAALAGRDLAPWFFLIAALLLLLETRWSRGRS